MSSGDVEPVSQPLSSVLGVLCQIQLDTFAATEGFAHECHGLMQPFIRLRTTETQKPLAGSPKTFTAKTGYPEAVVRTFEQIERQPV